MPEAQQRAEALTAAGVVLQFNGMVYLRPHDVTELVYKVGVVGGWLCSKQEQWHVLGVRSRAHVLPLPCHPACCCPLHTSPAAAQLLPADPAAAQDTLTLVEQELAKMDKQHQQIYSRAQRWPRRWLYAGCAALAVQVRRVSGVSWGGVGVFTRCRAILPACLLLAHCVALGLRPVSCPGRHHQT